MSSNCESCEHWRKSDIADDVGQCDTGEYYITRKAFYCDNYSTATGVPVPRICATCAWWDPDNVPQGGATSARLCCAEDVKIYTYPEHSCSKYARYQQYGYEKGEKTMCLDDLKVPYFDIPSRSGLDEANIKAMKERIRALEIPELIAVAEEIPTDILFQVLSLRFKKLDETVNEVKNILLLKGGKE